MLSLNTRVLVTGIVVLVCFFGLSGVALQQAFVESARVAMKERLLGQVYVLIAAAEQDDQAMVSMPDVWRSEKFSMISPHLFADISRKDGAVVWRSPAMYSLELPIANVMRRNDHTFTIAHSASGLRFGVLTYAVAWSDTSLDDLYMFRVAEDLERYDQQVFAFRRKLWVSLAGVTLLLLLLQSQMVAWELSPLRMARRELVAIESGKQERLVCTYPGELNGLTNNINALLVQQQERLQRYRHSLGDLAHSLKTPLAVLQSALDQQQEAGPLRVVLQAQIERMNRIVEYQLQRAATAGRGVLAAPVAVVVVAEKVIHSLQKVYRDKPVALETRFPAELFFHGDEGDLYEVLGNVVDNAFKWCQSRIVVELREWHTAAGETQGLEIVVDDDGSGILDADLPYVLLRGARRDRSVEGYGVGLSMVADIIQVYGGELQITRAPLGGSRIQILLPEADRQATS